ncbi:MAG: glycerophosphodiester phosphodiesterase, partial [Marivirga sp.]|nr:glycerophosphodiester phosphodiesterase [Marivirga sp.]
MVNRRLSGLSFLLLCCYVAFGQRNADEIRRTFLDPSSSVILVASHRATHNIYPENSLKAIQESINLGVDIIEIDVKVSADGVPFLMHDLTMDRTTTGKGDPENFTWAELQQFSIVDKGKKTSYKIPSLEDALELADGKIMVDLDLKTDRIGKIIDVVKRTDTKEIVFFFDSDYDVLSKVHAIDKELMIMPRAYSIAQVDSAILLFDPPVIHIDFSFYTKECTERIRNSYARIWINALGEPDKDIRAGKPKKALKKILSNGANII